MAEKRYQIELGVNGLQQTITSLSAVADAYREIAAAQQQLGAGGAAAAVGAGGGRGRTKSASSAAGASGGGAAAATATKYMMGPNQKLEKIREQMEMAKKEGATSAQADLEILEFRAKRSKELGERRLAQGEEAIKAPGLLDLFTDLNGGIGGLVKAIGSGNPGVVVKELAKGIQLLQEADGGMDIASKMQRGIGGASFGYSGRAAAPGAPARPTAATVGSAAASAARSTTTTTAATSGSSTQAVATGAAAGAATSTTAGAGVAAARAGAMGARAVGGMILKALMGPVGIMLLVVTTIVGALKLASKAADSFQRNIFESARKISTLGDAARLSGGTSQEIGRLTAYGVSPSEIPGMAQGLREKLSSDPHAMMMAHRAGISPQLSRLHGSQNEAKTLLEAADGLAKISNAEERLRVARVLGIEPMLKIAELSQETRNRLKADGDALGKINGGDAVKTADEFNTALGRVSANWSTFTTSLGKPFIGMATGALNTLADALRGMSDWGSQAAGAVKQVGGAMADMFPVLKGLYDLGKQLGIFKANQTAQNNTQQQLVNTMSQLNRTMQQGLHGGGERAQRAIGSNMKGYFFARALESGALRMGALSL